MRLPTVKFVLAYGKRHMQRATAKNWTSSSDGSAMLGHSDRKGPREDDYLKSWNSSHPSRGCSQDGLRSTGGDGLLYCFAVN
jgi:hypothetical protein